jgi:hypothetical protein
MPHTSNSDYFSARAAEARALAEAAHDPRIRAIHKQMAANYELLAIDAARRWLRPVSEG